MTKIQSDAIEIIFHDQNLDNARKSLQRAHPGAYAETIDSAIDFAIENLQKRFLIDENIKRGGGVREKSFNSSWFAERLDYVADQLADVYADMKKDKYLSELARFNTKEALTALKHAMTALGA